MIISMDDSLPSCGIIDQVPLPFVSVQHDTFTIVDEDDDVNMKCLEESLHKRQCTMHFAVNAGHIIDAHGW